MLEHDQSGSLAMFELNDTSSVECFYEVLIDESIYEFIPAPPPRDLKDFMRRHAPKCSRISFGAYIDADRKFPVGLLEVDVSEQGAASIGYLINSSYWGRGFASQLIGWAIRESSTRVRSFCATVDSRNKGSIRALEKNGFVKSGTKPNMLKWQPSTDFIYRRDL